jgi:hypothetical protein
LVEPSGRTIAQARADRIGAFRDELQALEAAGVLSLTGEQRAALAGYHDGLLAELTDAYDIDRSAGQQRLSLGLRIVSLLGAAALTAAVVLFFQRIWGLLPSWGQIAIAWGAPIALVAVAARIARRERTRYFTAIVAFVALGCFVLDVLVLGTIFNTGGSSTPLLAFSLFAFVLAYGWSLGWLLAAGLISLLAFLAATTVAWMGHPLDISLDRPETVMLPAIAMFFTSLARPNLLRAGFPAIVRRVALFGAFVPLLVLAESGGHSFLPFSDDAIEGAYQAVGFAGAIVVITAGIRNGWTETLNIGAFFFGVLMLFRFVDWWWEWLPKYLFFLLVAAVAIAMIALLRRLRARLAGAVT